MSSDSSARWDAAPIDRKHSDVKGESASVSGSIIGLGAIDFLFNPFSEETLLSAIRTALFSRNKTP